MSVVASRPLVLAGALVVAALGLPAVACAAVRASPTYAPSTGPVLAGGTVVWGESLANGDLALMEQTGSGRPVRRHTFASDGDGTVGGSLSASAVRLGVEVQTGLGGGGVVDTPFSAPLGQPLASVSRGCVAEGLGQRHIAVSGDAMAYMGSQCGHGFVADFGSGSTFDAGDGLSMLRLAGRYLAALRSPFPGGFSRYPIEVVDVTTGSVLYAVSASALPGPVVGLDVQADGKVLFAYGVERAGPQRQGIAWASPDDPTPHRLLGLSGYQFGRLVGDRAVIMTKALGNPDATMRLVALDGTSRVLTRRARAGDLREKFDFDGTQVAWLNQTCTRSRVNVTRVDDFPIDRRPGACRVIFTQRPRRIDGRTVRLGISCASFGRGCGVVGAVIEAATRHGRITLASQDRHHIAEANDVRLRLTAAGKRLLANGSSIRARVVAYVGDTPNPPGDGSPSDAQRRTATVRFGV